MMICDRWLVTGDRRSLTGLGWVAAAVKGCVMDVYGVRRQWWWRRAARRSTQPSESRRKITIVVAGTYWRRDACASCRNQN